MLAGKISFSYELVFLWYFKSQMGVDEAKNSQGWSVTFFISIDLLMCHCNPICDHCGSQTKSQNKQF